jgi:hypothetical protein
MPILQGPFSDAPFQNAGSGLSLPMIPIHVAPPPRPDQVGLPVGRCLKVWALSDTGSGSCVVPPEVVRRLGLSPHDTGTARSMHGASPVHRFHAAISLASEPFEIVLAAEHNMEHLQGAMILGLDWLKTRTFTMDGPGGRFSLSW